VGNNAAVEELQSAWVTPLAGATVVLGVVVLGVVVLGVVVDAVEPAAGKL
jgi:hypothetical protein